MDIEVEGVIDVGGIVVIVVIVMVCVVEGGVVDVVVEEVVVGGSFVVGIVLGAVLVSGVDGRTEFFLIISIFSGGLDGLSMQPDKIKISMTNPIIHSLFNLNT